MRTSVLSILGAFLGLNILSAQADVSCTKSQEVISARAPALAKALQDSLNQSSKGPCDAEFWDTDFSTYRTESTVFTITHAEQDGNLESCKDSFDAIIRQCIGENGHGGTLLADGFLYEVYHDDTLEGGLAKRAGPKPAKPAVKPAKPAVKPASPAVKPAKPVKPVKPVNPVKPATPATPKPVKPVPAPATPAKPANNNKGCSPKPKGKNGRLRSRVDTDCEDLETIWKAIPANKKAKGDSAHYFDVNPARSDAWGITYLYGCTGILISDPNFVVVAHMQEEGGDCIQLADQKRVEKFLVDKMSGGEVGLAEAGPDTQIHMIYTKPKTGDALIEEFQVFFRDFMEFTGTIQKKEYTGSSGVGEISGPTGKAAIQVIGGQGKGKNRLKVFWNENKPLRDTAF